MRKLSKIQSRLESTEGGKAYCETALVPDESPKSLHRKIDEFMNDLKLASENSESVENETSGQSQADHKTCIK